MILDYVEKVTSTTEMRDLWAYHTEVMAGFGLNRVLYGFTRFRTANSLGNPRDMLILTNYDRSFIRPFLDDGLYLNAPMTLWALNNVGVRSWRETERMAADGSLPEAARRIWEFNKAQGYLGGFTISFQTNSTRAKGAIALTALPGLSFDAAEAIWAEHGAEIEAMNNVLHLRLISMPHTGERRPLTRRQREVLEWVGDGKTTAEIAEIMGLKVATVEKHLRLAREGLDVTTTTQAVLKASFQNQIYNLCH